MNLNNRIIGHHVIARRIPLELITHQRCRVRIAQEKDRPLQLRAHRAHLQLGYTATHAEKFNNKLEELNREACLCIEDERYSEAAVYLN